MDLPARERELERSRDREEQLLRLGRDSLLDRLGEARRDRLLDRLSELAPSEASGMAQALAISLLLPRFSHAKLALSPAPETCAT